MSIDFNKTGGSRSDQVRDHFEDADAFESLLSEAEYMAETEKEREFVSDLEAKFDEYGMKMFLSDRQLSWLQAIAAGD